MRDRELNELNGMVNEAECRLMQAVEAKA